jgi:hypothetical protein
MKSPSYLEERTPLKSPEGFIPPTLYTPYNKCAPKKCPPKAGTSSSAVQAAQTNVSNACLRLPEKDCNETASNVSDGKLHFHPEIGRRKCSRQQITLHCKNLRMQVCKTEQQHNQGQYESISFQKVSRITFTTQTALSLSDIPL